MSIKGIYSEEANNEIEEYMQSKAQYITINGSNARISTNEAIQALYSMTIVLADSAKSITPSEKILFWWDCHEGYTLVAS